MIDAPFAAPAVNDTETDESPGVATRSVGAAGTARGVTDTAADAAPSPAAFTARRLTEYVVPFVRPPMVAERLMTAGENAVQVLPLSVEYL